MGIEIAGTGAGIPKRVVANRDLQDFLDTSDQWIITRTGIRQRRILTDESLTDLAQTAALGALANAGITADQLDFILCATVRGDMVFPGLSGLLQKRLGAICPGLDLNAACAGFIYALDMAEALFAARGYRHILVVCAEGMSRLVDWQDRSTCVLFGDGAGAVVLTPGDMPWTARLSLAGDETHLYALSPTGNCPYTPQRHGGGYAQMNGQEIYKFAVAAIEQDIGWLCGQSGLLPEQIDFFLLHQANRRIIEAARGRLKLPQEKFPVNIDRYGNTSSASIPILLDELNRSGRLAPGQHLLLSAFGAGLTTGSCLIRWSKPATTNPQPNSKRRK